MANQLVIECAKFPNTFKDCRIYLAKLFESEQKVLDLENAHINVTLEYYIKYIEAHDIIFNDIVHYCVFNVPYNNYWELIIKSVLVFFRRSETNNLEFIPF
jgi:hypothetical protein